MFSCIGSTYFRNAALVFVLCTLAFSAGGMTLFTAYDAAEPEKYDLANHVYYFVDPSSKSNIQQIQRFNSSDWTKAETSIPSFGATKSSVWLAIRVKNTAIKRKEFYLKANYALLDHIEYYVESKGEIIETHTTGDTLPFETRPIDYPTFVFPFAIEPNASVNLYLKIQTLGSLEIPLKITEQKHFFSSELTHISIYVAVFAILFVMGVYNLFVFVSVKDLSYLYYSGFSLSILMYFACTNGFAYQKFWPDSVVWHSTSSMFFSGFTILLTGLFTIHFLPLNSFPRCKKTIIVLIGFASVSTLAPLFLPYDIAFKMATLNVLFMTFAVVLVGFVAWIKGEKVARFFMLTWSTQLFSGGYMALGKMGVLPVTIITEYGSPIGSVLGVVMLSFALADRIALNQQTKIEAQNAAVENLNRFKNLFDSAIEGIFVVDFKGRWLSANPSFLSMLGYRSLSDMQEDFNNIKEDSLKYDAFKKLLLHIIAKRTIVDFQALLVKKDGSRFWASVNARVVMSKELGYEVVEGSLFDVTARVAFEEKLNYLARHDPLTSLYNRRAFEDVLLDSIKISQSNKTTNALLYLDLDQFKVLNDTCGHTAGDNLLVQLSARLESQLGENQILARLGGDEFGLLMTNCDQEEAVAAANRIQDVIRSFRYRHAERDFAIGVSIGLVCFKDEYLSLEGLLSRADAACFMAKDLGRNRIHIFHETDEQIRKRQNEMEWVNIIKDGIAREKFCLMYQHIFSNRNETEGWHYEILLRLKKEEGGYYSPAKFIPAAERYGLMPDVDHWVVESYFRWLSNNPEHLENLKTVSINLSGHSLGDDQFIEKLEALFEKYHIDAHKICFEVTETMAITRLDRTLDFIYKYKKLGCKFALDDFGTGFSSYAYLKEIPVDFLKIDGFFIRNMTEDPVDRAMVNSICQVAATMNIQTIAEFVENANTLETLKATGIHYSQGYLLHRPELLSEFREVLVS